MEFILYGFITVIIFIWVVYISVEAFHGLLHAILAVATWTLLFAGVFFVWSKEETKGPCVQKEIQMHYNATTKTLMPAEVCVLRGKWVEDK